ncbi:MAG: 3,4-dihydroxy-2-butanone-4-phosphate synthase [Mycobacterium sp.]
MLRAVAALAAGKIVLLVDDREDGAAGYLVFAAELASCELLAFAVRHSAGYVCVSLPEDIADQLQIPAMCYPGQDPRRLDYGVTVDASTGITTGISARDRAYTIRRLASHDALASDFNRPGHVVPIRAKAGGVITRAQPPEAIVDLAAMAGLRPLGGLTQLVSESNQVEMAQGDELVHFAERHGLALLSIASLFAYRWRHEKLVRRVAEARIPLSAGLFTAVGYTVAVEGRSHVAFVHGDVADGLNVPVYVHLECLTGDVFESTTCACRARLTAALNVIAAEGSGAVLYLRPSAAGSNAMMCHERYDLPTASVNTDGCTLRDAAQILNNLSVRSVRLLTNDSTPKAALERAGITVTGQVNLVRARSAPHTDFRQPSVAVGKAAG